VSIQKKKSVSWCARYANVPHTCLTKKLFALFFPPIRTTQDAWRKIAAFLNHVRPANTKTLIIRAAGSHGQARLARIRERLTLNALGPSSVTAATSIRGPRRSCYKRPTHSVSVWATRAPEAKQCLERQRVARDAKKFAKAECV
jgi:predicted MarR family transcription regulator